MEGSTLRGWRIEWNIGVRAFARMLGVEPSTVVRWENGTRPVPPYMEWVIKGIESMVDFPVSEEASDAERTGTV